MAKCMPDPMSLARHRIAGRLKPGMWWYDEYEEGNFWARIYSVMEYTNTRTGQKIIDWWGASTDAYKCENRQYRDSLLLTLTEAQGRRCGLQAQLDEASEKNRAEIEAAAGKAGG